MMNFFWFRRDLRLEDNAGLYHALKSNDNVQCVFIFDRNILDRLQSKSDPRVSFIYNSVSNLKNQLKEFGADLWVFYGRPQEIWKKLMQKHTANRIYTNRDYESYGIQRDLEIKSLSKAQGCDFLDFKDQVIFEGDEVLKDDGTPYTVFTPYKRKWLRKLEERQTNKRSFYFKPYPSLKYSKNFYQIKQNEMLSLKSMGFENSTLEFPSFAVKRSIIKKYSEQRDYPAINGTSRLGIHFRFGTISIREKARNAQKLNDTFLSELVWRDFYSQILQNFPHVEKNAFRAKYERIEWRNNEKEFNAWCKGETGYPMVDAGMRELNTTGHMHNRVRMIVSSFLTKHLLIDWRWGEQYFANKLLDFDLASNNGGWQWAAGCGTDAAPYFRIFNPTSQQKKFDSEFLYIKKWIKEWGTDAYPQPIVDHKMARERCLTTYKMALNQG